MEKWISILQTHSEVLTAASIVALGLILIIFLSRILRQIKRLNRSLTSITDNIQAYFDVIMQEEPQQEEPQAQEAGGKQYAREVVQSGRINGEAMPTEEDIKKQQEEEVFNAVLQEYFS